MPMRETAVVFGVGPGLGWALARRFASDGMQVAAVARDGAKLAALIQSDRGKDIRPFVADVSSADDVLRVFDQVDRDLGGPNLVVFNAGAFQKANVLDIDPADFERCWRIGCLGGLHVGQAAARRMVKRDGGTIIFSGATAALRGSAGFANLAVPKFRAARAGAEHGARTRPAGYPRRVRDHRRSDRVRALPAPRRRARGRLAPRARRDRRPVPAAAPPVP